MILVLVVRTLIWGDPAAGWAVHGVCDPVYGWHPASLYGNYGRIPVQDVSGIETPPDLHRKEFQL